MYLDINYNDINEELRNYVQTLNHKPSVELSSFEPKRTALIVVDVINGFTKCGAFASNKVAEIVPNVRQLMQSAIVRGFNVIAFADSHSPNAMEFESFPTHCLANTYESQLVDELLTLDGYTTIEKNSTNGFHAPKFKAFLKGNPQLDTFIVCGDCTDICVLNLCLTLKTYYNQLDKPCNMLLPMDCVETYDAPNHSAQLMNLTSLKLLENSGITVVKSIV